MKRVAFLAAMALAWPGAALAQSEASARAFTGPYAGAEIGAHEHHFYLDLINRQTGETRGRYYRAWGIGGGAFAGYDLAVVPRLRLGVEAGISLGGAGPEAHLPDGSFYVEHPRYGFRGTGRAGFLLSDRLMAYGTFGYGGHRYRLDTSDGVAGAHDWGSSFTIGAGLEYRASQRVGVRLDFRHLDNQMSHILVGVPVRW